MRRARAGLGRMVPDEHHFLTALEDGMTPADELLAHYYGDWGDWNGDLSRIYAEYNF